MPVRLRQFPPREITVAVEQFGLVIVERLADPVDIDLLGRARPFERIAGPDDDVGAAALGETADFTAHADRFGGARVTLLVFVTMMAGTGGLIWVRACSPPTTPERLPTWPPSSTP